MVVCRGPGSKDTRGDDRLLKVPSKCHCRNWQRDTLCELLQTSCRVFGDMSFHGHYTHSVDILCVFKGSLYLGRCAHAQVLLLKYSLLCNSSHKQDVVGSAGLSRKSGTSLHSLWRGSSTERDKEFSKYY